MVTWDQGYYNTLADRFEKITGNISARLGAVSQGRVAPALEDIAIGSARRLNAAVLFFDIRAFTDRCSRDDDKVMERALIALDCVIPMVMHVVHDHDGYVEKNTGDGIMAIVGADKPDSEAADAALAIAERSFYVIRELVNPYLLRESIDPINARIGIDLGPLLIARIGVASGTARHDRNFLTAVGATANVACRLQQCAGTNEIWVGDRVKSKASPDIYETILGPSFRDVTPPPSDWIWIYKQSGARYRVWCDERRPAPTSLSTFQMLSALSSGPPPPPTSVDPFDALRALGRKPPSRGPFG